MDDQEMQDRIDALEAERDDLQDRLDKANDQLDELKKVADNARDLVRAAYEQLEKGDF